MKHRSQPILIIALLASLITACSSAPQKSPLPPVPAAATAPSILSHITDPKTSRLRLYWKDDTGKIIGSLGALKSYESSHHRTLRFAMNGGMYKEDRAPLGLYMEQGKRLATLNKDTGFGNFYMKPNGIFYLTKNKAAVIIPTEDFRPSADIQFATQSGPMLLINGRMHPRFVAGSKNLNLRNGVGILPDGRVLFAISRAPVSFYDFAAFFQNKGCRNALYLDGFVSRCYLPEENFVQTDGSFGVIIGEVK